MDLLGLPFPGGRGLDQLPVEATRRKRLFDPPRAPARELSLVLGVALGKALVVEGPRLDQPRNDLFELVLFDAAIAQPPL
jgi:hypothetical protein